MRIKVHNLTALTLLFVAASTATPARTADELDREHRIKAAFIYNFIKFVDWPKEKMPDPNEPIVIGIIGDKGLTKAFTPVKDKKIKNRDIIIRYFEGFERLTKPDTGDDRDWNQKMEMLKECHALLLCKCGSKRIASLRQIVKALAGSPVLTISEADGFLESGGIINFLKEEDKVRFEINFAAAKRSKLEISSKLLSLARRILQEEPS